jgi:hypothetical protein
VRQLEYDFATDSFLMTDLCQLADHIAAGGFTETAMQTQPDGYLWAVRADGVLACLTYDREQRVRAWTRHILGGTNARVESVCVVPNPDGTADDVYVAVARTVNGAVVRHIEYLAAAPFRADLAAPASAVFMDAALTYAGAPVFGVTGLGHLEGETVRILADGSVRQPQVVTAGAVPVTGPASSTITCGLPMTSTLETLPMEAGAVQGLSAQGRPQRISNVTLRLLESAGGSYGTAAAMDALVLRQAGDPVGEAVPLFTGDKRVVWPGGSQVGPTMVVQTSDPLPLTVLALIPELVTSS